VVLCEEHARDVGEGNGQLMQRHMPPRPAAKINFLCPLRLSVLGPKPSRTGASALERNSKRISGLIGDYVLPTAMLWTNTQYLRSRSTLRINSTSAKCN
jgi:hypothetical protein